VFTAVSQNVTLAWRHGKFIVWAEVLGTLGLRGHERVLDAGCGRGAVLTMVGERVPKGSAVGLDIWTRDQSGNSIGAAERKLTAEGVRENCELVTGDMRAMPFPDVSFDLVVSSLVIHSIRDPTPPITWCSFMAAALSMRS
jgi:arsenite methyltransferase